jgi:hypothetical protein
MTVIILAEKTIDRGSLKQKEGLTSKKAFLLFISNLFIKG